MTNINEDFFYYFKSDLFLLYILMLIEYEQLKPGQYLYLKDFIKEAFFEIPLVKMYLSDTNDYTSFNDFVFQQIDEIGHELKFYSMKTVVIKHVNYLPQDIIKAIVSQYTKTDMESYDLVEHLANVVEKSINLKKYFDKHYNPTTDKTPLNAYIGFQRLEIKQFRKLYYDFIDFIPEFIQLSPQYDKVQLDIVNKMVIRFIRGYTNDEYLDWGDAYFPQQLNNFYQYLKKLPKVKNSYVVPFSSITEEGFSIIKILKYLELEQLIEPIYWKEEESWIVKFYSSNVDLALLAGTTANHKDKLYFWDTGEVEFKGVRTNLKEGDRNYSLLKVLYTAKGVPFSEEDIKVKCNPIITKKGKFNNEKDIDDTIRYIRQKLQVKIKSYLPVGKRTSSDTKYWVWNND